MFSLFRVLPAALLVLTLTAAADEEVPSHFAIMGPVDAFVDAFNAKDAKLPDDAFTAQCTICDETAPFLWAGAGAVASWWSHLVGATPEEKQRIKDQRAHLTIGNPRFLKVVGPNMYFVIEATLTWYDQGGNHRTIGIWTVTESKTGDRWLIDSLAWGALRED